MPQNHHLKGYTAKLFRNGNQLKEIGTYGQTTTQKLYPYSTTTAAAAAAATPTPTPTPTKVHHQVGWNMLVQWKREYW